jgi:hypothetical protein
MVRTFAHGDRRCTPETQHLHRTFFDRLQPATGGVCATARMSQPQRIDLANSAGESERLSGDQAGLGRSCEQAMR